MESTNYPSCTRKFRTACEANAVGLPLRPRFVLRAPENRRFQAKKEMLQMM